jgi:hypothetical protein
MDTYYAEGRVSRLAVVHADTRHQRVREDYYSITTSGLHRHHSSFKDFNAKKSVLAMARAEFRKVVTPATCMQVPLLAPWNFDTFNIQMTEVNRLNVTLGVTPATFQTMELLAELWTIEALNTNYTLAVRRAPQDSNLSVLTIDSLEYVPLLLQNHADRTNFTIIDFSTGCNVLADAESKLHHLSDGYSLGRDHFPSLFDPTIVADVSCEQLG